MLFFYFFSFDTLYSIIGLEEIISELTIECTDDVYFKINVCISRTDFAKPRSAGT